VPPLRSGFALQGNREMTKETPSVGSQSKSVTILLTLRDAARVAATGRDGGPPHTSSLVRWITKGTRRRDGSRLRLRAVRAPGGWRTTESWVLEFYDALTRDRLGVDAHDDGDDTFATATPPTRTASPVPRSATERRAASERAAELLKQMGC
jgi:hypothetical protein